MIALGVCFAKEVEVESSVLVRSAQIKLEKCGEVVTDPNARGHRRQAKRSLSK